MPNILLRNLDEDLLRQLRSSAEVHHRSLQAEIHEALRKAAGRDIAETRRLSSAWLKRLRASPSGPGHSDSAELIREERDSR